MGTQKIKGFFAAVFDSDLESGARSLMQSVGIGRLRPNMLLMGYKRDWATCPREELLHYFNIIQWVNMLAVLYICYTIAALKACFHDQQRLNEKLCFNRIDRFSRCFRSTFDDLTKIGQLKSPWDHALKDKTAEEDLNWGHTYVKGGNNTYTTMSINKKSTFTPKILAVISNQ